ncbi:hypothetical protein [Nocardioides zeicaulis]|uniref:Uncharacterized protein n=1 Tax=Nocardioides zeicaulis TaxID=1776857 RepID=A0ABV6E4K7_9ACTN
MTVLRDWFSWAVAWVLVVETPVWLAVAADAWQERTEPTLEPMAVPGWVVPLAYAAGVAVPLGLLLVVAGLRATALHRAGMLVGAAGLAVGAVAFSGFPDGVVGGWYVGLTAAAAVAALLVAVTPSGPSDTARPVGLPGLALVAAGVFLAWTCWHGASYWDWRVDSALGYLLGFAVAVLLVALGATAGRWASLRGVLRWVLVVVGVLGLPYLLAGASALLDGGALYRWEEDESPWEWGTPWLLLGAGLVATGVAAWRRRGDLAAWSLAAGTGFGLTALWQDSTWGSVMR